MLHPADDSQQARNSVVQGCAFFFSGSHTHCYISCILYIYTCIYMYVYVGVAGLSARGESGG